MSDQIMSGCNGYEVSVSLDFSAKQALDNFRGGNRLFGRPLLRASLSWGDRQEPNVPARHRIHSLRGRVMPHRIRVLTRNSATLA